MYKKKTSSSGAAKRPRDASYLSVVSFNIQYLERNSYLSNAMHRQNIYLPLYVFTIVHYFCERLCVCVTVRPSHFLSTRLQVRALNGFLQLIA